MMHFGQDARSLATRRSTRRRDLQPRVLSVYDLVVHGLSNRFAWRCPRKRLTQLYQANFSANHLEAGVGTGLFIDRAGHAALDRLVVLDINENAWRSRQSGWHGLRPCRGKLAVRARGRSEGRGIAPFNSSASPMCCTACLAHEEKLAYRVGGDGRGVSVPPSFGAASCPAEPRGPCLPSIIAKECSTIARTTLRA